MQTEYPHTETNFLKKEMLDFSKGITNPIFVDVTVLLVLILLIVKTDYK